MARDSESTRGRIFDAAFAEFARAGFAGARVDRIAAAARANKQLIYAHFGSKKALFDHVATQVVARFNNEVHFDAERLPEFAGEAYDFFAANPEVVRLGDWHALDPPDSPGRILAIEQSLRRQIRGIAKAQAAGAVDKSFAPDELLAMIISIARSWAAGLPEFRHSPGQERRRRSQRRKAVVEATRRLVTPI
jgi:AcrR family transcriptional regulator